MDIVGHRGAAGEAPENTLAGFFHAIKRGVRHVELDIQLSADQQLMVVHDGTLDRTTGMSGAVSDFTAEQLLSLDARRAGPVWPQQRDIGIPLLSQVLEKTPKLESYQLEVKSADNQTVEQICDQLLSLFPDHASAQRVIVTSFDFKLHHQLPLVAPHLRRGLVSQDEDCVEKAIEVDAEWLIVNYKLCDERLLSKAHSKGLKVSVWTVNSPGDIERFYELGVESLITDYPSMALPLLSSFNRDEPLI